MDEILLNVEDGMEKTIENLNRRFTNIRAGRANPNMLDEVNVEYYGVLTPLKQIATVGVMDSRTISIKPFDKGALKDIEKAIINANLGLNPNNNGESILINLPQLTEDRRKELVKQVKAIAEDGKIGIRNARHDGNNAIKKLEVTDDEKESGNEEIQKLTDIYNKKIEVSFKEKEKELLTV